MTQGGKKKGTLPPLSPHGAVEIRKGELTRCLLPARKCSSWTLPTEKGRKALTNRPKKMQVNGLRFHLRTSPGVLPACLEPAVHEVLRFRAWLFLQLQPSAGMPHSQLPFLSLLSFIYFFFQSSFNASLEKISSFLHTLGWCVHFLPKKWIFFRILYILIYSWLIV